MNSGPIASTVPPSTVQQMRSHPPTLAREWNAAEQRYANDSYTGSGIEDQLDIARGLTPVLFTAPHAIAHPRNGAVKVADVYTGGLAMTLARALNANALVVAGAPSSDGNFDAHGPFKEALHDTLPRVDAVIDLHGMRDTWEVDVCLGRGALPHLSDELVDHLTHHLTAAGFRVGVDTPFNARRPTTVTTSAQRTGTAAVQVELARHTRNPQALPGTAHKLATALAASVHALTS